MVPRPGGADSSDGDVSEESPDPLAAQDGVGVSGFPLMLRLEGRPVLVVGGGRVGASKAAGLLAAGATVTMVATWFGPEAAALVGVQREWRRYRRGDLDGMWLVVTALDDAEATAAIAADAEAARIFCNAADRPEHCSATMMALHRQGGVTVAVSTNGVSPAAGSWLRNRIATQVGRSEARVAALGAQGRSRLRAQRTSEGLDWFALFDRLLACLDDDDEVTAQVELDAFVVAALRESTGSAVSESAGESLLAAPSELAARSEFETRSAVIGFGLAGGQVGAAAAGERAGRVLLVGAGPGHPDLLTVAAIKALGQADVVVHDALVGEEVFAFVAPGVEQIDVGKRPGASVAQEFINELLVDLARQGRTVVRLKGGDPYLFGRGGEEALALQEAGIAYEMIPGVTSALAAPALAGIPVTQRGMAAAVTVITGHRASASSPVDWEAAARLGGTLVVLMGVSERGYIAASLQQGGMSGETPVALVERASRPDGSVRRTTLAQLGATRLQPPAILVIGAVAGLDVRAIADASGADLPPRTPA